MVPFGRHRRRNHCNRYLNGVKVGTGNNSFGNDLVIGSGQDCLIDEIMIYDRVLKDFELMQLSGRVFSIYPAVNSRRPHRRF